MIRAASWYQEPYHTMPCHDILSPGSISIELPPRIAGDVAITMLHLGCDRLTGGLDHSGPSDVLRPKVPRSGAPEGQQLQVQYLIYVLALMQNRPTSRAQPCLCCTGHGLTPSRRSTVKAYRCASRHTTPQRVHHVEAMWGLDGYSTGETLPIYLVPGVPKGKDSAKTRRECPC